METSEKYFRNDWGMRICRNQRVVRQEIFQLSWVASMWFSRLQGNLDAIELRREVKIFSRAICHNILEFSARVLANPVFFVHGLRGAS